ncbi:MAG: ornithine cyclodeaminase family protein, partial [Gemmatimonadales bacterium]
GEVLEGTAPGRQETGDITLFKSLGLAAQDLATAARLVADAPSREKG